MKKVKQMKKTILILLILLLTLGQHTNAQKILTLKECYDQAMINNPISGEKKVYADISKIKDNNLSKGWLPTLDANGSFLYNSSVIDMSSALGSLPVPGIADAIKPLPNEQYKLTIDITQVFYDGGAIKGARAFEKADRSINEKQVETDLYKVRSQINSYYFNLLLLERQQDMLSNWLDLINKRISAMQSALNNGAILMSDKDVLTSEKIKLEQQLRENEIRRIALLKILSDITGIDIDPSTELALPAHEDNLSEEILRPELQMFALRKEQLAAGIKIIESRRMPKAFGFATLGYGNPPGSNFFKDEFAPYYLVGAGIKWNISDWNKSKNEKQIITLQQGIIDSRKTDLNDNLKRLLESKRAEIDSYKTLLESDSELIALRKKISASAESQYENGTITATEYLNEINSEKQAMINFEIHKINLALTQIEYMNINGAELD